MAEQVRELGGTERVVQAMAVRYPDAALVAADFATTNVPEGHPHPLLQRARLVRVGARRRHFLSPLYARRFARAPVGISTAAAQPLWTNEKTSSPGGSGARAKRRA